MSAMAWKRAVAGSLGLVLTLGGYVAGLGRLRRAEVRDQAANRWWFGYARDGVNLAALGGVFAAYLLAEVPGPLAFVFAVLLVCATYVLDWTLGKRLGLARAGFFLVPLVSAVGFAALFWPAAGDWLMRLIVQAAPQ